jgi:hypothetical protein
MTGTVVAKANVSAVAKVIAAPVVAARSSERIEEAGFKVTWYRYEDGLLLVLVHDDEGNLVDGGGGVNPDDCILGVIERLLPPASDEE